MSHFPLLFFFVVVFVLVVLVVPVFVFVFVFLFIVLAGARGNGDPQIITVGIGNEKLTGTVSGLRDLGYRKPSLNETRVHPEQLVGTVVDAPDLTDRRIERD